MLLGRLAPSKCGDLLPEVIQHRVGRRVAVMGPPMHLAAGDHVDARHLLFQDGGLHRPELRIGDIAGRELTQRHQPVERFVPARNAVGADDGGGIGRIKWHSVLMLTKLGANLWRRARQCGAVAERTRTNSLSQPVIASGAKQSPSRCAQRWRLPRRCAPNKEPRPAPVAWAWPRSRLLAWSSARTPRRDGRHSAGHADRCKAAASSRAGRPEAVRNSQ